LIDNVRAKYQQELMSKLLYLLGAIDVLGNPLNVLQQLFGGYKNLIEDDNKIQGTKNLIQNGIGAFSGFTSKITDPYRIF